MEPLINSGKYLAFCSSLPCSTIILAVKRGSDTDIAKDKSPYARASSDKAFETESCSKPIPPNASGIIREIRSKDLIFSSNSSLGLPSVSACLA